FAPRAADRGARPPDVPPRRCVERAAAGRERSSFIELRVEPLPPGVNVAHAADKALWLGLLEHDPFYVECQCLHQLRIVRRREQYDRCLITGRAQLLEDR